MQRDKFKTVFLDLFVELAKGEKHVEHLREKLAENEDFEPYAAFKRLDREKKKFLVARDLAAFLSDNDIILAEKNCRHYLHHYDFDRDGRLSFQEFLNAVLPFDHPSLRTIVSQRPTYEVDEMQRLPITLERFIAKLFETDIKLEMSLTTYKDALTMDELKSIFHAIDKLNQGFIDFDSLGAYLESIDYVPYDEELIGVLHRLDKDDDGRVTMDDFLYELSPYFLQEEPMEYKSKTGSGKKDLTGSGKKDLTASGKKVSSVVYSPSKKPALYEPYRETISPIKKEGLSLSQEPPKETYQKYSTYEKKYESVKEPEKKQYESTIRSTYERSGVTQSPKKMATYEPVRKPVSPAKKEGSAKKEYEPSKQLTFGSSETKVQESLVQRFTEDKGKREEFKETVYKSETKESYKSPGKSYQAKYGEIIKQEKPEPLPMTIFSYLKDMVELMEQTEKGKEELAMRGDFNLMDLYRAIDKREIGQISARDIEDALYAIGMKPSLRAIRLFIKRYDTNKDELLSYSNFAEAFTPKRSSFAGVLQNKKGREPYTSDLFQVILEL